MFGTLVKKQLLETLSAMFMNKNKSSKKKTGSKIVGFVLLCVFGFLLLSASFFFFSLSICKPLCEAGFAWLYFALFGIVALFFGLIGSVFNTYSTLYKAKDNEILLSLPIPPRLILFARLIGVGVWGLFYVFIVFFPAMLCFWIFGNPTVLSVILSFVLILVMALFVLSLSCILGWCVAKLSLLFKSKSKNFVIVFASLIFIVAYYFGYSKLTTALNSVVENAGQIGYAIKGSAYPIYLLGRMAEGDVLSALFLTLPVLALFAACCFVLSKTFIKIATSTNKSVKEKYVEKRAKTKSVESALLYKEIKRFTGSANYMLNCALATFFLPVLGIFALVKNDVVKSLVSSKPDAALFAVCAIMCALATMNDITAPSVSLEGKNIWLPQSLPVTAWQALKAKIKLHLLFTVIPVLFTDICILIATGFGFLQAVFLVLISLSFVLFSAEFGLLINLKSPNLSWTNEAVPVKQSFGVVLAMFSGWIFIGLLAGLYFLIGRFVLAEVFLLIALLIVNAFSFLIYLWLKKKGTKIFAAL